MEHLEMPLLSQADIKRFWNKVDKRGANECWPWTAGCARGYGKFRKRPYSYYAHRIAFILAGGVVPPSHLVCHTCDNPPCCNPGHLFVGTSADNSHDRDAKGRTSKGAKHAALSKIRSGEDHPGATLTRAEVDKMRRAWATGRFSRRDLAAAFSISILLVAQIIKGRCWGPNPYKANCTPEEYHYKHDKNQLRGEDSPRAKLTGIQVLEIRRKAAEGVRQWELAASYGVTRGLIGHIVRRLIWKSV